MFRGSLFFFLFLLLLLSGAILVALVLVGVLVVHSIVKVLVIKLLICSVQLSDSYAKSEHYIFIFHPGCTMLHQAILLVNIGLSRVERTQDDRSRGRVLEETLC